MREIFWTAGTFGLLAALAIGFLGTTHAAETAPLIQQIQAVGKEGAGNVEAAKAWRALVKLGPPALTDILKALDEEQPISANWLRAAVDAIAENELTAGRPLPKDQLEAFVVDTKNTGLARRLAFEWLAQVDPTAPDRLIPGMVDDPSAELRRDAVARVITEAEQLVAKGDKDKAKTVWRKAFTHARDKDQVILIADQLEKLGDTVDRVAKFGFIPDWLLIGPFDSSGGVGFGIAYPPEKGVDLASALIGKDQKPVQWFSHSTTDKLGVVDLNTALGKHKGSVAYAFTTIESPVARLVEFRVGSNNAIKIFLNGQQIFAHEEYHHGDRMDQYVGRGMLKKGRNDILLKVCQNEQTQAWAQKWSFQLRVCDAIGGAVPMKVVTPKNIPGEAN
ncbi:MAG: hypothetical protein ACK4RK_17580 [Gemmataceae bacterium]